MNARSWRLSGFDGNWVQVCLWHAEPAPADALTTAVVETLFAQWLASPTDTAMMGDIYAALMPHAPACLTASESFALHPGGVVLDAVRGAFARRELWAQERVAIWPQAAPRESKPLARQLDKTFIEIRLFNQHGAPVPGERYRLTLPDGSERQGTLDDHGFARVDRIDPGTCDVTFPDIDGRRWQRKA